MYNTPNTWAIYMIKLTCEWVESQGGVQSIQKINEKKAGKLYEIIDSSDFWHSPVEKESRSIMNVVWRLQSEALEEQFLSQAEKRRLCRLEGTPIRGRHSCEHLQRRSHGIGRCPCFIHERIRAKEPIADLKTPAQIHRQLQ